MNWPIRRVLPIAISVLLAACAGMPSQAPHAPIIATASVAVKPPSSAATVDITAPQPATNVWDGLRSSFAMSDCDADPAVIGWANDFTRDPNVFEKTMREALPRLVYVQQVATHYRVPGEFVLLPWVESRYRPVPAHRHHAAGMWQIMPATARSMGLRIDHHYDGRLDLPIAAHAVMKLLAQYHDRFHDWRVADYAFNAGEFRLRRLLQEHGAPTDEPVIPDLPVPKVTREHLVRLLAIACVIREPERFHVALPILPDTERLVRTPVARSITLARAADLAGMPVAALRRLNPAFGGDRIDTTHAPYLMLPADRANRFQVAMDAWSSSGADENLALMSAAHREAARPRHRHGTHVVNPGESLWRIAREYSTSVAHLEDLNHLAQGQAIQPGQVLQVDDVD